MTALMYGNIPVPYSAAWTEENTYFLAPCPWVNSQRQYKGLLALHQKSAPAQGRPTFAKPHMNRQRESLFKGLCDICAMPMRNRTKVSMSEERWTDVQGVKMPLVVEPLCCRGCARVALTQCPHLKRQIQSGQIIVRQVYKYDLAFSQLTGEATMEFAGVYAPGTIGHLKMRLQKSAIRSLDWLLGG